VASRPRDCTLTAQARGNQRERRAARADTPSEGAAIKRAFAFPLFPYRWPGKCGSYKRAGGVGDRVEQCRQEK